MKSLSIILLVIAGFIFSESSLAQYSLKGADWEVSISEEGKILNYKSLVSGKAEDIPFRDDAYSGPSFEGIELSVEDNNHLLFSGKKDNLKYSIQYKNENGILALIATIENIGKALHIPDYERLILGLDAYMEKYPDWNYTFFPTMLRAEKTHFFGYAMSPLGRVLAFASPDPLASWNYHYMNRTKTFKGEKLIRPAPRIYTISMDLIHCLPLPNRHPQHVASIKSGEKVSFKLYMKELSGLDKINDFYAKVTKAPVVELDFYTVAVDEMIKGTVISDLEPEILVFAPQNHTKKITPSKLKEGLYSFSFPTDRGIGYYKIIISDKKGKTTEVMSFCREKWSWYLNHARHEALYCKPTSTHHAESFYPFYSYFLAREHLPDQDIDMQCEEIYQQLFSELFDPEVKEMRNGKFRLQDASTMIGVLTDRYRVSNDIKDMENAAGLVEFLIRTQKEDGAYYAHDKTKHYTSVIYPAKSIMEYLVNARELAEKYPEWKKRYNKHYKSVKLALNDLANRVDNVGTEGLGTFEDGMIACSATQLALGALRESDPNKRAEYKDVSLSLTDKHRCLTLLKMPDSRMHGATLRFWEAQYTVSLMHGMMNSPCGWSAWKTYGIWYQYLLSGNEDYLKLAVNSLGTFMQLVDQSGKLRFSFSPDPYIEARQFLETPVGSGKAVLQNIITGEQYIDMASYWHEYPNLTWKPKWGIDNFVHEVFKCMEEIILTNAYVVEQADGSFNTYNCELIKNNNRLIVHAKEQLVDKLHVNLKNDFDIEFRSKTTENYIDIKGLRWVGAIPDDIKVYDLLE